VARKVEFFGFGISLLNLTSIRGLASIGEKEIASLA